LPGSIKIGADVAAMSIVLAELLVPLFNTHFHIAPLGPTSPPTIPIVPAAISSTVAKISA
jgi:hypothetical protein